MLIILDPVSFLDEPGCVVATYVMAARSGDGGRLGFRTGGLFAGRYLAAGGHGAFI
jgi:hypothetical protein